MCPVQTVTHVSGRSLRGFVLSSIHPFHGVLLDPNARSHLRGGVQVAHCQQASIVKRSSGFADSPARLPPDCRGEDHPRTEVPPDGAVRKWDEAIPRMVKTNPKQAGACLYMIGCKGIV